MYADTQTPEGREAAIALRYAEGVSRFTGGPPTVGKAAKKYAAHAGTLLARPNPDLARLLRKQAKAMYQPPRRLTR